MTALAQIYASLEAIYRYGTFSARNRQYRRAIEMHLIHIGYYCTHLPPAIKRAAPGIPWSDIEDLSTMLAENHHFLNKRLFNVIVRKQLPVLRTHIHTMLGKNETGPLLFT